MEKCWETDYWENNNSGKGLCYHYFTFCHNFDKIKDLIVQKNPKYQDKILLFYGKLNEEFSKQHDMFCPEKTTSPKIRVGDKKYIETPFKRAVKSFLKEEYSVQDKEPQLILKPEFEGLYGQRSKKRGGDFEICIGGKKTIIEIKTQLSDHAFAEAFFEGLISKWDNFFILSLISKNSIDKIDRLFQNQTIHNAVTGLFVTDYTLPGFSFDNLEKFLDVLEAEVKTCTSTTPN